MRFHFSSSAQTHTLPCFPGKRPRLAPPEKDVIDKVASGDVTQKTLATRLMEHIERFDTDMVGVVSKGKNKTRRYTARMGTTLYLFHLRLLLACQDTNPYTSTPPPIPVQALEYQMQQGITEGQRVDAFLRPQTDRHRYTALLTTGVASIQLLCPSAAAASSAEVIDVT